LRRRRRLPNSRRPSSAWPGATDDKRIVSAIARLLGEIQVLQARMGFEDAQLKDPGPAFALEVERSLLQAAAVYAPG
jgi:hypothetical protein